VDPDTDPDPAFLSVSESSRIQGFDDQKLKKKIQAKFLKKIFYQNVQFTFVQASREAFSFQKRTSSTSKN
jgi:hypothetical protein